MKRKRVACPRRRGDVSTATREKRFAHRIVLSEAAHLAGMSLSKASWTERGLGSRGAGSADPRDVAALADAVDRLVESRGNVATEAVR